MFLNIRENKFLNITIFYLFSITSPAYLFSAEKNQAGFLLKEAIDLSNQKKYDDAKIKLEELIKTDPENVEVHFNLGIVYFTVKEYDKALEEFLTTIELDSKRYNSYYFLGLIYEAKFLLEKDIEKKKEIGLKALNSWKKFIKLDKKDKDKVKNAKKHIKLFKEFFEK